MYQTISIDVRFQDGAQATMNSGGIHVWPSPGKPSSDYEKIVRPLLYAPALVEALKALVNNLPDCTLEWMRDGLDNTNIAAIRVARDVGKEVLANL